VLVGPVAAANEVPVRFELKRIDSPTTGLPLVSCTVAVSVDGVEPSAGIDVGDAETETEAAGPAVWVRVTPGLERPAELSVAVIVGVPAALELVIVAV